MKTQKIFSLTERVCSKCGLKKPINEFYKKRSHKWVCDSYYYQCQTCQKKYKKSSMTKKYASEYMKRLYRKPKNSFKKYKYEAKRKGFIFTIDVSFFGNLVDKPCFYCGIKPMLGEVIGIDRIDNKKGYEKNNCLPCCSDCNYSKRTRSISDFVNHCRKVVEYQNLKLTNTNPIGE